MDKDNCINNKDLGTKQQELKYLATIACKPGQGIIRVKVICVLGLFQKKVKIWTKLSLNKLIMCVKISRIPIKEYGLCNYVTNRGKEWNQKIEKSSLKKIKKQDESKSMGQIA